jgi:CheY-like chemotaxis protein
MTIFCIDDDKTNQFIAGHYIRQLFGNIQVIYYDRAYMAIEKLKGHSDFPEIIFLDLNMPGMDGWDFLDQFNLLEICPKMCRIFILSSSISLNDINRSKTYTTVQGFIIKPITIEKLKTALGEL